MKIAGKKVFVGLSGGVDSSVSAYLLKNAGYDVRGVFIKVWQPDFIQCSLEEDRLSAMRVCSELEIPFETLDLEEEYKKGVIDYMIDEYKNGRTPNPDVTCNKEVKFGAFLNWAKSRGADFVATGHYAQVSKSKTQNSKHEDEEYQLLRGADAGKDQSYFLWTLRQDQLKHILFPVGHLQKREVREIALKAGLSTAKKKDSQGLCFVGNVNMKDFLKHFMQESRGNVLNENGEVVGFHNGSVFLTLGERHGFTITKKSPNDTPYYVIKKDVAKNTVTVSRDLSDLKRKTKIIELKDVNFISGQNPLDGKYSAQTRYHGEKYELAIIGEANFLRFELEKSDLVASGQSLVFYDGDICIGGGVVV